MYDAGFVAGEGENEVPATKTKRFVAGTMLQLPGLMPWVPALVFCLLRAALE